MEENRNKDFDLYVKAVLLLAELKQEQVIPEIKQLSEMPKTKEHGEISKNIAVEMSECFGSNPETIKILEGIAKDKTTMMAWRQASDAIGRIEKKKISKY